MQYNYMTTRVIYIKNNICNLYDKVIELPT